MKIGSATKNLSNPNARRCTKLRELINRWHEGLNEIRVALLAGDRRRRGKTDRHTLASPESVTATATADRLTPVADDRTEPIAAAPDRPEPIAAAPLTGDVKNDQRELVPLPSEPSQALAAVCERLLQELEGEEVRGAEIRFVVHKHDRPRHPRLDPESAADLTEGELVLELRRLLAWSGGTIADVARALEIRGADLDEGARELLREEIDALDADVEALNLYLADAIDWDRDFGCLLGGEIAPFDDFAGDEDDEADARG